MNELQLALLIGLIASILGPYILWEMSKIKVIVKDLDGTVIATLRLEPSDYDIYCPIECLYWIQDMTNLERDAYGWDIHLAADGRWLTSSEI